MTDYRITDARAHLVAVIAETGQPEEIRAARIAQAIGDLESAVWLDGYRAKEREIQRAASAR